MPDESAPAPAAPTQPTTPKEGEAPAQAAPVDPFAELDGRLKATPIKYKVGGKERSLASVKELIRKAEIADGLQAKEAELNRREAQFREAEEKRERLKTLKGRDRVALLRELYGETFDEAAEESILERIEREKGMASMTPAERAAREEAETYRAQLEQLNAEKQRIEEEKAREEEERSLNETRQALATYAIKALTAAKLPKEAAPDAIRRIATAAARAAKLGLDIAPERLAEDAVKSAAADFRAYTDSLEGDALFDFLGEKVVRAASRALLARSQGAAAPKAVVPAPTTPAPEKRNGDIRSPMAAWRDFEKGILR